MPFSALPRRPSVAGLRVAGVLGAMVIDPDGRLAHTSGFPFVS